MGPRLRGYDDCGCWGLEYYAPGTFMLSYSIMT
jgi:hypothetical protein